MDIPSINIIKTQLFDHTHFLKYWQIYTKPFCYIITRYEKDIGTYGLKTGILDVYIID